MDTKFSCRWGRKAEKKEGRIEREGEKEREEEREREREVEVNFEHQFSQVSTQEQWHKPPTACRVARLCCTNHHSIPYPWLIRQIDELLIRN